MAARFEPFSFSTSWNWRNSVVGSEIVGEILSLGFGRVELNYRISEAMLQTIAPLVERGELIVSSVHNVFPSVDDQRFDTDSRLLGYEDEDLRAQALALGKRSIDFAAALGAGAVVVHPGELLSKAEGGFPSGREYDERLKALYGDKGPDSPEYRGLLAEFKARRAEAGSAELERITRSIGELAEYIAKKGYGLRIGIENRAMCHQIPDFAEMSAILSRLEGAPVGMWFDMGHGGMMRTLGLFDDRVEASRLAGRLVGVHIHDIDGVDDHFAPYSREGLDGYLALIEAAPIKVLELGAKNTREAVLRGTERLQEKLRERRWGRP
jgi:sugar phosphate isomerase/epimerase